jgi:hypothetical protein
MRICIYSSRRCKALENFSDNGVVKRSHLRGIVMFKRILGLFGKKDESQLQRFQQLKKRTGKTSEEYKIDVLSAGRYGMAEPSQVVGRSVSAAEMDRRERMLAQCSGAFEKPKDLTPPATTQSAELTGAGI